MRRLAALLLAVPLLAGCASDQERYCEAVEENQTELSDIAAQGGQEALLEALDIYRALREEAPRDITDEWDQVIRSIAALEEALEDAKQAMRFVAEHARVVAEGAAACAVAAALGGRVVGDRIVAVVSGGNIDLARFASLVGACE